MTIQIKLPFGEHERVQKVFDGQGRTVQACKEECDINNIMAKYQKTGLIEHVNQHNGDYGDYVDAVDYHFAMNQVLAANESFNSLPSTLRKRFDNDPSKFLEFVQNPDNEEEMYTIGLKVKPNNVEQNDEEITTPIQNDSESEV